MANAIIAFVRKTELGKVKTRLAADIGDEKALVVYEHLLQHTHDVLDAVAAEKYIFYTEMEMDDIWAGFHKRTQVDGDLGVKMADAFDVVFRLGFKKVAIVGSDCIELNAKHIHAAFDKLDENDAVIGPCYDGGYYLLAMKKKMNHLFVDINWSTATVYEETIKKMGEASFYTLPMLHDIDTIEDLKRQKQLRQYL